MQHFAGGHRGRGTAVNGDAPAVSVGADDHQLRDGDAIPNRSAASPGNLARASGRDAGITSSGTTGRADGGSAGTRPGA